MNFPQLWALENSILNNMSDETKHANEKSHHIGNVDGVMRCTNCEIASWKSWHCPC